MPKVCPTDNNKRGHVYANRPAGNAREIGCEYERLRPARKDWNARSALGDGSQQTASAVTNLDSVWRAAISRCESNARAQVDSDRASLLLHDPFDRDAKSGMN